MSKKSKTAAKVKRLAQKRARKTARQAQYESFKKAGQNKKSKRSRRTNNVKGVKVEKHAVSFCGNLGCALCYPKFSDPRYASSLSCIFSKQFTSKKVS